jgi:hypothetical protein
LLATERTIRRYRAGMEKKVSNRIRTGCSGLDFHGSGSPLTEQLNRASTNH